MTIIKPDHTIAHEDRFLTWLNAQEGVEARNTVEVELDNGQAIIRQFERDPADGMILLEQTEAGSVPKAAEPVSVEAPDWLREQAA